ncbi:MAG: DHH family phosphoesterase [Clostridia bacterium]|nr:DHH family phosphoesterase [Clostridia bacterium]
MKKLWKAYDVSIISFLMGIAFFGTALLYNRNVGIIGLAAVCTLMVGKISYHSSKKAKLLSKISTVYDELNFGPGKAFDKLTVPCVVVEKDGTIIWFNSSFSGDFEITKETKDTHIQELLKKDRIDDMLEGRGYSVYSHGHYFSVFTNEIDIGDGELIYLIYFFNQTELKKTEKKYLDSKPSVILTVIDNADEVYQNFKESDCTSIFSYAEQMIDDWASSYGCLCRKFSNARMLIFAEEKNLQRMIDDKFSILEDIRNFTYEGKSTDISLSVGVGKSDDIIESNKYARQALDMAQSRGGDQVAIKKDTEYVFYGGVSAGFEKRNKVRTRLIAKSIAEIISNSDNVLIMGHRFSDFDSFGSSVGMLSIAEHFSKPSHIIINEKNTLAGPLVDLFKEVDSEEKLISPSKAHEKLTDNTLLIVTDTHKKAFTECPEIIDKVKRVMVIDHHRKSVGYMEDTVMFYHLPGSSSASEMVAEIAQYVDNEPAINRFVATALLSGIMLDTRNFILRAGVRTFEAAAYLRSRGANTVECKKLFSNDMGLFRNRNSIIDLAQEYRSCAVSFVENEFEGIRLVTSQAADEMLNIEGIKASFVVFSQGGGINISARSYGEINVQLIMENLGGGGHQTMSACQLGDISFTDAEMILKKAIDDYYDNL